MNKEFRVYGPPGTGKTSRLATRDIPRAVEKYGSDKVMVTSYTRAAAKEISFKKSRSTGQKISVDPENVGTMHSIMFHALNNPDITETGDYIDEWNKLYPNFLITGTKSVMMDEVYSSEVNKNMKGDRLLSLTNIKRNKMISPLIWTADEISFYNKWVQFKKDTKTMDFTDLIEMGLNEYESAPNQPNVIFVDEAQDFTLLQLTAIRKWGKNTDWIVLVGDDDQSLYSFIGATPDSMINPPIADEFKTVLKQSYRVPQQVLDRALDLIIQVDSRQPKEYFARKEDDGSTAIGEVREVNETYKNADRLIEYAEEYIAEGKSVVFLATCSYMLEDIKKELKEKALPYHNPYRRRRRDWNPLFQHGTLNDFLDQGPDEKFWTVPQFVSWAKHLKVGNDGLVRKIGKKGIKRLEEAILEGEDGLHSCREVLHLLLEPSAINAALARDTEWLLKNIQASKAASLEYPVKVYEQHGRDGIEETPLLNIGTIHSVKGATFDVVFLFPDISYLADVEMGTRRGIDSMLRVFYVGMTRAKHSLILCRPNIKLNPKNPRMYVPL